MIEQSLLDQLLIAIGHASWAVLVGYAILVVVGLFRSLTHGRFRGRAEDWSSASSTMLGGVGLALAAGGIWWHAVAIAVLAAPSSSGFWRLVRSSVPVVGGLLGLVLLVGCSGAQHVASPEDCEIEQRILLSVEAAVDAVDIALPPDLEGRDESLSYAREGLQVGAAAVEACEVHRDGDPWLAWIGVGLKILRGLVAILRMAGVEAPGALGDVLDLLVAADHAPLAVS